MSGEAVVFVEIPAGSRNKYEWDSELGGIVLDRRLFTAMTYPADYGYVEGTLAEDGDPLDALVLVSDPTFPGCRIRVRTIGVFHMADEKGPDEKLLCEPLGDPAFDRIRDIDDVAAELRDEIEHFFQRYKDLEPSKKTETRGWRNRDEAEQNLAAARARLDQAQTACGRTGGMIAPMIQNRGMKIPRMNMTQCPFRSVLRPSTTSSTTYRIAKPPPIPHHI
jgi:inorganic pyrophosphatase